ncbi:MAG: HAD family phosphatase [Candidatus Pacebacteria bacterium]|nr:HAD family phosphatase [Candidatus Paceibacterota bacterium]
MQKKTTIIFDCFGVICAETVRPWMLKNLGDWESIKDYFHELAVRFDLNQAGEEDIAKEFAERSGKTPDVVQSEIDEFFLLNLPLIDYMEELKKKGYKIGLISNGHHDSFERKIFAGHPTLKSIFDHMTISSQVGMLKPDPEIYRHALENLGSTPEESVFIDDNERNTVGAEAISMTGVLFTDLSKLKEDLQNLGI